MVSNCRGLLFGKPFDGLGCMIRAAPTQKFQFLVFKRIRRAEELLQFLASARWEMAYVLQIGLEGRSVRHSEDAIVPLLLAVALLLDFEHADRSAF